MKIVKALFICLPLLIPNKTNGQDILNRKYAPEQLKEDLRYFLKTAEEIHPNLYHSVSRETIEAYRQDLESQMVDSMNAMEFGRLVIPLSTKFMDGHTSLWFPYNEAAKAYSTNRRFPFSVDIIDRQIFIAKKYSDESSIQIWDEIVEINGQSSKDLIEDLLSYKNGELESFRLASIQNAFPYYLWLIKGWGNKFDLRIQRGGTQLNITVNGLMPGELNTGPINTSRPLDYSFSMKDDETGLLDFRSMRNVKQFKIFLDSSFQLLHDREIKHLIIDVRYNGGGDSRLGDLLFDYLTYQPYNQVEKVIIKTSSPVKISVRKKLKWFIYPLYPLILVNKQAFATLGKKDGSLTEIKSSDSRVSRNKKNRFNGDVYLLIGPGTFSSANMLASTFSCYGMGKVVGEESGEPLISYGELTYFKLPNTKADAWASCKSFYLACADTLNPNNGVIPDYQAVPTFEDLKSNRDAAMEFTIDLIKTRNHE